MICGNTIKEHSANLCAFSQRCRELNVSRNSKKCSFGENELNWLGYVISEGRFKPDPERTKSLKEYKEPKNMKELERFLGMANYYSKFVSRLASPLQELKNSGQFQWSSRLADGFRAVKAAILDSFLTVPDSNQEFVLETDASGIAITGVLTQHGCPVAVASKRLSSAEQSSSAVELEALAIVYCASKFRQFLLGRPFVLYTDQRALSFLFSGSVKSTFKNNKLIRLRTELSGYNFRIAYKPGKEILGADAFSRAFALQLCN